MQELAEVAERLRTVRDASRRFLELHAVEVTLIAPGLDRFAADLWAEEQEAKPLRPQPRPPGEHDA